MDELEFPEDSDTSDDEYIPEEKGDLPSEVESDGDPEDDLVATDKPGSRKRGSNTASSTSKKRSKPESTPSDVKEPIIVPTEEDKKKLADDIWSDFMRDTGFTSKNNPNSVKPKPPPVKTTEETKAKPVSKAAEKIKITKVFEFAGEEVTVEQEVAADSAEARLANTAPESSKRPSKTGGLSGIGGILSQLGKKPKISTLEKTKLDWDKFKRDENLEEELQTHNKGKDGYLERQDFLQRADLRRFEIEKQIRSTERSKRLN